MNRIIRFLQRVLTTRSDGVDDESGREGASITAREASALAQGDSAIAAATGSVVITGGNSGIVNLGTLIQQASAPGASPQVLRQAYLARVLQQSELLPLFAGDTGSAQIKLSSVYTALMTQRSSATVGQPDLAFSHGRPTRDRATSEHHGEPAQPLSALAVMNAERKLVLLGGPGSGKSTFVNYVALSMAGALLGMHQPSLATLTAPIPADDDQDGDAQAQRWDHRALLPVRVVLRDLAAQLPPPTTPLDQLDTSNLLAYLDQQLSNAGLPDFFPHLKSELLETGGLILLDGLDEVPDAARRREQIKLVVQRFVATFSRCRFLVTSRTYAYQKQDWKLDGFAEVGLLPFSRGQVFRFADTWYAHMVEIDRLTATDAAGRAEILKREVSHNPRIGELAERPLLLTLIAQLQTEGGGALPQKREALYAQAVEMLLNKWESLKVRHASDGAKEIEKSLAEWLHADREKIRKKLNELAFEAHRDQPQLTGTADITQERLIKALLAASESTEDLNIRQLENYLRDRAGILAAHGDCVYQFPHRTFQEYLAACHLTDDDFPDRLAELSRNDPNRWREVALLAAAKAQRGSSKLPWDLADALCPAMVTTANDVTDHWGALLAGQVLAECADLSVVVPRHEATLTRVREHQLAIMSGQQLPAVERTLAGRTLSVLGDPRPEVMSLDGMQFCQVPAGPFTMGEDAHSKDEKPQHQLDLPYTYFISRYPVTTAQWRAYAEESGQQPGDGDSLIGQVNAPAVYVSWHEAQAFCVYLSARWCERLPAGVVVTLPSEAEWEKAARGGASVPAVPNSVAVERVAFAPLSDTPLVSNENAQRLYPWSGEFDPECANAELAIGQANAVGCYPRGVSPYGCAEMAGNVWEWTRSLRGFEYPYRFDDPEREVSSTDRGVAARGTAVEAMPASQTASTISPTTGSAIWVFVWCCVGPLFSSSARHHADLGYSESWPSGGGAGETSPA